MIITVIQTLIICLVAITPLIVNYNELPYGFEIPKSLFSHIITACIVLLYLVHLLLQVIKARSLKSVFPKKLNWYELILSLAFLAVLYLSLTTARNKEIALVGNPWRLQGTVFVALMFLLWQIARQVMSKYVVLGVVFSSVVVGTLQSAVAISQFIDLYNSDREAALSGFYVNGTFGQGNFFGGYTLITLFCLIYGFIWLFKHLKKVQYKIAAVLATSIFLMINLIALAASFSYGSWVIGITAIGLTLYIWLQGKLKNKYLKITLVLAYVVLGALGLYIFWQWISTDFRSNLWFGVIGNYFNFPNFGFGIDNQHLFYEKTNQFPGLLIDRAHNVLVDVLITLGRIGFLVVILYLIPYIGKYIKDIVGSKRKNIFLILIIAILFAIAGRMMIHTNSVTSVIDLVVFAAMWTWSRSAHRGSDIS